VWQVYLFILVITSKWNPCVFVSLSLCALWGLLPVKKLIVILIYLQGACQLKLPSGVFGVTSLFISYTIKAKAVCVCHCWWRNWYWYIYNALDDTMSLKWLDQLFREYFKLILDLDLYSEHMPEERITGSKSDLNLPAGLTYMQVYTVGSGKFHRIK